MTKQEFAAGVSEMRRAFDLNEARSEVLVVWYAYLREIEQREWSGIVRRIVMPEERFPQNLIRTTRSYQELKTQRPLDYSDLRFEPEDEQAARECFEQIAKIGEWGQRVEIRVGDGGAP